MIKKFADKYRLQVRQNTDDGTPVITGDSRTGLSHIYEYGDGELGVCVMPGGWHPQVWGHVKRKALALGMKLRQNGDYEGCLSFDPENPKQAKFAVKLVGARVRREVSLEVLQRLSKTQFKSKAPRAGSPLQP